MRVQPSPHTFLSRRFRQSALSAALTCITSGAMATPVILNASIANNTHLDAGSHAGVFDGSSLLPAHFQINSASYSLVFADDQDILTSSPASITGATATGYSNALTSSYYNGLYTSYYYRAIRDLTTDLLIQITGESEGVSVVLAGQVVGSGATQASTTSQTGAPQAQDQVYEGSYSYGGNAYLYSCGNRTCTGYTNYVNTDYFANDYSQTTVNTLDYSGGFTVAGNLTDVASLNQLLDLRQLQLDLLVNGDLNLVSASLNLDITEIAAVDPGAVPEPPEVMLGLAGLGAWRFSRRRRVAV